MTTHFRDLVESVEHSIEIRIFTPGGRFDLSVARSADGAGRPRR